MHPAKFFAGLLAAAQTAGARVHGETAVLGFVPKAGSFAVETAAGPVEADHVIVATNGYTDGVDPWLGVGWCPCAAELSPPRRSQQPDGELMPKAGDVRETRKLHYYYRPSPDGTRFSSAAAARRIAGDPAWPTQHLRRALADIFPVLDGVPITHSWWGHVP